MTQAKTTSLLKWLQFGVGFQPREKGLFSAAILGLKANTNLNGWWLSHIAWTNRIVFKWSFSNKSWIKTWGHNLVSPAHVGRFPYDVITRTYTLPKSPKKKSKSEFWISHLSWDTEVMTKQYLTFLSWKLDSPATCAFPWFPCFGEKIIRSRRENNSLPHKSVGKKNAFHVMLRETHFLHCLHLCLGQGMVIKSWSFVKFCVPEKEPKNIFKLQNFHNIFKVLYLQLPYL